MRASGGGGGPGGMGGGGERRGGPGGDAGGGPRKGRPERQLIRTIYVLPKAQPNDPSNTKPVPVQIRVGISDGINTEVLDGLEEGAQVVTSMLTSDIASSRPGSPPNPFGGGGMRRF